MEFEGCLLDRITGIHIGERRKVEQRERLCGHVVHSLSQPFRELWV